MNEKKELTHQLTAAGFQSVLGNDTICKSRADIGPLCQQVVDAAKAAADAIYGPDMEVDALKEENDNLNYIIKQLKQDLTDCINRNLASGLPTKREGEK